MKNFVFSRFLRKLFKKISGRFKISEFHTHIKRVCVELRYFAQKKYFSQTPIGYYDQKLFPIIFGQKKCMF